MRFLITPTASQTLTIEIPTRLVSSTKMDHPGQRLLPIPTMLRAVNIYRQGRLMSTLPLILDL